MSDKKQLNNEELEKVAGGSDFPDEYEKYRSTYTVLVDKYAGEIGKCYFFKNPNNTMLDWAFGELRNSYELKMPFCTVRTHDIKIIDASPLTIVGGTLLSKYGTVELNGNVYKMYKKPGD